MFLPDKRFKAPHLKRSWQPKMLWELHKEILNRVSLGEKNVEVAKDLGCHPQVVTYVKNSSLGRDYLERRRIQRDEKYEAITDQVLDMAQVALSVYNRILSDDTQPIQLQLKAASDILRHPIVAPKTPEVHNHLHIEAEERRQAVLSEMKERGLKYASARGMLVEEPTMLQNATEMEGHA